MHNISLLPKRFTDDDTKLEIFKSCSKLAKSTDYALLLGSRSMWMLKSSKYRDYVNVIAPYDLYQVGSKNSHVGIRPIIYYEDIANKITSKSYNKHNVLEVTYGEYPQTIVSQELATKLEQVLAEVIENNLSNGKHYHYRVLHDYDAASNYFITYNTEYLYEGEKYVRVFANKFTDIIPLSNGESIKEGKLYWVKVEPIKWLVDKKTGICISKYILSSGEEPRYVQKFLKTRFRDDIEIPLEKPKETQEEEPNYSLKEDGKEIELNQKTNNIITILTEIDKYKKYYYGSVNIKEKVESLIDEYNSKINNIFTSRDILTLDNQNKELLYIELELELNSILSNLKVNYENNKVYHDIIELIDNIIDIIDNKREATTELEKDIKVIIDIIIPYLNNQDKLLELKKMLFKERKIIKDKLINMSNLNMKIDDENKIDNSEGYVRKILHVYLMNLYRCVFNKAIIEDIMKDYQKICLSNYHKSKSSVAMVYLEEINKLVKYIGINGNKEEIDELVRLLNNITFNHITLDKAIISLSDLVKKLYQIIINIDERNNNLKSRDEWLVSIPKVKTKAILTK